MTKDKEKAAISAVKLAEMMGISTKTLAYLDKNGILVAARRESGRRYYLNEHIDKALKLMEEKRKSIKKVKFRKTGTNSLSCSVDFPKKWLEEMNVTEECPEVYVAFNGESIQIISVEEYKKRERLKNA